VRIAPPSAMTPTVDITLPTSGSFTACPNT
jgi:hypothetical protein